MNVQCVTQTGIRLFFLCWLFLPSLYSADQKILRGMLHIYKLQNLHLIPFLLQNTCSQAICNKCRHSFFQNTVFEQRLQQLALYLFIYFMLAAGNR